MLQTQKSLYFQSLMTKMMKTMMKIMKKDEEDEEFVEYNKVRWSRLQFSF